MDGSPQVVRFDATTLWHFDAAEWAPSTASKAARTISAGSQPTSVLPQKRTNSRSSWQVRLVPKGDIRTAADFLIRSPRQRARAAGSGRLPAASSLCLRPAVGGSDKPLDSF